MPLSIQRRAASIVSALTLFAFLVHGYHPYGEDGGLYIAGIKKLLDPTLYPHWTAFVTEHLRFSLYAPFVAGLVRGTHLGLEPVLLLLYIAGIFTTLYAGWMLLARAGANHAGCAGGVALLACWLDLPIAGTSQMLMDPYVTARTLTTPLTLLAAAWTLGLSDRSRFLTEKSTFATTRSTPIFLTVTALFIATVMHPLMAGYALAIVVILFVAASRDLATSRRGPLVLLVLALCIAGCLQLRAPAESPNYVWVAMTRYYWFPFRWEWYEQLGLIAPLAVIATLARYSPVREPRDSSSHAGVIVEMTVRQPFKPWRTLARATMILAVIALTVAILFCRARLSTHLVARLQPLRTYGFVYEVMTLLLGGWLGERVLKRHAWRWILLLAGFGALMFYVQRSTYPASAHLELPGRASRNPYVQAFLWVRDNTPKDSLFALDAHYITRDGEDAEPFRALAERSALADYSKDGGEASITPELTPAWVLGQAAQTDLERSTDAERLARLRPLGVNWIVLRSSSETGWSCPYENAAVKVCRLP